MSKGKSVQEFRCYSFVDSDYRNALSEGVLRLQEQGKLASMKIKWWKEKKGGGACAVSGTEFLSTKIGGNLSHRTPVMIAKLNHWTSAMLWECFFC